MSSSKQFIPKPVHRYRALSGREEEFAARYVANGGKATEAVREMGIGAEGSRREIGRKLLSRAAVQREIERIRAAQSQKIGLAGEQIVRLAWAHASYDLGEIGDLIEAGKLKEMAGPADIAKLPPHLRICVAGWDWNKDGRFIIKWVPKTPNVELVGKHFGLWDGRGKDEESPAERESRRNVAREKLMGILNAMAIPEPMIEATAEQIDGGG